MDGKIYFPLLDEVLRSRGYIQTLMIGGEYKEASRKEKMIQRMNYHDLVPYVKLIKSDFVDKHEIDVNFHFDSKDNDITKTIFNMGITTYHNDSYEFKGLPWETHLAQLCIHFFREGSSSLWTSGRRDVVLYKIVDVVNTFRLCKDYAQFEKWAQLMKQLKLERAAYYTIYYANQFYPDTVPQTVMAQLKPEELDYLYAIEISGENRIEVRKESFEDAAFNLSYLRKVSS